ncbi:putative casparian strip membrane protein [Helianthus debilis subsp. tardiflorus]
MEIQYKEEMMVANGGARLRRTDAAMRFLALALTLAAAVVLGLNKQTTTIPVKINPSIPPVDMQITAKWIHMSAFVYFVIINAIACSYTAVSLIFTLATRGRKKNVSVMVTVLDLVMVALLFSAIGASGAVGLIGYTGNSHVQWREVCNVFDKFCHQAAVAMGLSFIGSMAYLLLVIFGVYKKL